MDKLYEAAQEYLKRQTGESSPVGKFDSKKRWYPDASEERDCCRAIRRPSAAWPYSLIAHCRTMGHIAELFGVDIKELRKEVNRIKKDL